MEFYNFIINLITGIYLISFSFIMQTENLKSSMIFKIIPFFLGLGSLFITGKLKGLY